MSYAKLMQSLCKSILTVPTIIRIILTELLHDRAFAVPLHNGTAQTFFNNHAGLSAEVQNMCMYCTSEKIIGKMVNL